MKIPFFLHPSLYFHIPNLPNSLGRVLQNQSKKLKHRLCTVPFPRPWRSEKISWFDILMCGFSPYSSHSLHRSSKSSRCTSAIMWHGDLLWESCFIFKWLNTSEGKSLPTPPTHASLLVLSWGFCSLFYKNISAFCPPELGFLSVAAFQIWAVSHGSEPRGKLWERNWGRQRFNFKCPDRREFRAFLVWLLERLSLFSPHLQLKKHVTKVTRTKVIKTGYKMSETLHIHSNRRLLRSSNVIIYR